MLSRRLISLVTASIIYVLCGFPSPAPSFGPPERLSLNRTASCYPYATPAVRIRRPAGRESRLSLRGCPAAPARRRPQASLHPRRAATSCAHSRRRPADTPDCRSSPSSRSTRASRAPRPRAVPSPAAARRGVGRRQGCGRRRPPWRRRALPRTRTAQTSRRPPRSARPRACCSRDSAATWAHRSRRAPPWGFAARRTPPAGRHDRPRRSRGTQNPRTG
mmetsp:Transcript_25648/g.80287  ORF Transcript_25648/g.80287 Transcript_25648/m.80287 type:complete len:219 (-) Transcript_25648:1329-1985(-)